MNPSPEVFVVRPNGRVCCLYTERLELGRLGRLRIGRASQVEPDARGRWFATLRHGPRLGPFRRRSQALEAEVRWLQEHLPELARRCDDRSGEPQV